MTCVVAVEGPEGVWLGSDGRVTTDDAPETVDTWTRPKYFTRDDLVVGFAGKIGACQLAQYVATWRGPKRGEDSEAWLVRAVAPAIRAACRAHDMLDADGHMRADFLFCHRGRSWVLALDHSLVASRHGYAAIGAGASFALGSLASTTGQRPKDRARLALEAAERHAPSVARPFSYHLAAWTRPAPRDGSTPPDSK